MDLHIKAELGVYFIVCLIGFSDTQELNGSYNRVVLVDQCSMWFQYYNTTTKQCECYITRFNKFEDETIGKCTEQGAMLHHDYCMTYDEEESTLSVTFCSRFVAVEGHNMSEPGFIKLPNNISELNNYMCGPLNREGVVCSECRDGYGIAVTSPKFSCSYCNNVWYGVPLYLLLEIVPVMVFYIIVLVFHIDLTSSPMTTFIVYCNLISISLTLSVGRIQVPSQYGTIIALFLDIFTLDFFQYAIPPFCISPSLKIGHANYLRSVSTFSPFFLIALTWLCITLHSRHCGVVVWTWNNFMSLFNRVIPRHIKCNMKWNTNGTIISAFSTFFFLSFAKVILVLVQPVISISVQNLNIDNNSLSIRLHSFTDPRVEFGSKEHLPWLVLSIFIFLFAVLPPTLILTIYPAQPLRDLLFKYCWQRCKLSVNFFVEKFYSCYKDGLNGERDMRSFVSIHFFIVLITYALHVWIPRNCHFFLLAVLYGGCSLIIGTVQPHKKRWMSIVDSLILANLALLSFAADSNIYKKINTPFYLVTILMLAPLPLIGVFSFFLYKKLCAPLSKVIEGKLPQYNHCCNKHKVQEVEDAHHDSDIEQDRVHDATY